MTNNFYLPNGDLTAYSFACGYVQKEDTNNKWKKIFMEHGAYHVMAGNDGEKWRIWDTFDKLTDARKRYRSIKLVTCTRNGRILQELSNELAN